MQKRKILIIGLLAIFAIVIAGSVSAFDFGFLGGDSGPETVNIEGINFTIPEGYKENTNYSYENDDGDAIAILIANYGKYKVTDEILKQVADEKKTINDHKGFIKKDGVFTIFAYEENGDLVTITASDESVIDQVVV